MLLELRENLLQSLYGHDECDHEVLLQALVNYEMPKPNYNELLHMVLGMNKFTRQAWDLETCQIHARQKANGRI